jgi:hypothetical protein
MQQHHSGDPLELLPINHMTVTSDGKRSRSHSQLSGTVPTDDRTQLRVQTSGVASHVRRASSALRGTFRSTGGGTGRSKYDATSNLCMTVMILFIAIEIPQCAFNILMAIIGENMLAFYTKIEDVFEMLAIVYR